MSLERREHLVFHVSQLDLIISEGEFLFLGMIVLVNQN